jgi:hypothetical protein
MSTLHPGNDGDQLPAGTLVFRIGKNTQLSPAALEGKRASPEMFELSTDDKNSPGKRLSVWVEGLTVADQAWALMGAKPERTVVACLSVDSINAIPAQPGFSALRVEWEQAVTQEGDGKTVPNRRLGAEGHSGIAGLLQGGNGKMDSTKRKALRSALADIAEISLVPVPHDIPEDHIRLAAYFICEKGHPGGETQHWIMAVRQLRRERARRHKSQIQPT